MTALTLHAGPHLGRVRRGSQATAAKAEMDVELATAVAGGGPGYVERHRARGKLTARERIEALVDPDSPFLELCPLAGGSEFQVGASLVTGIGVVEGVECVLVANDPTVRAAPATRGHYERFCAPTRSHWRIACR